VTPLECSLHKYMMVDRAQLRVTLYQREIVVY
jgi:hypothetical protein